MTFFTGTLVLPVQNFSPVGYTKQSMLPSPTLVSLLVLIIIFILLRMRPRRFYFVRHGQTLLNAKHIRQGEDGALSEKGKQQASEVGKALMGLHIHRIISSAYPRARETAMIISKLLQAPVLYSSLLAERRNPSEIIGKGTRDKEVAKIVNEMDLSYHDDNYRYSDEENFAELKKRAEKCLALLARQGSGDTVVITHHHFLKMLIAYALYRDDLHSGDFIKLSFFNISDNAGITVCEYHPWHMFSPTHGWEIIGFNERPAS